MILTCSQMKAIEERAFADGITAEALMEDAGTDIARAVMQFFPKPGHCVAFIGKGHNGGDALVAARHLAKNGWSFSLNPAFPIEQWAPLTKLQHERLPACGSKSGPLVVLDGLLGIGAGGALREPIRGACREINRMATDGNAHVFALDIPTGLDGDAGTADADAVRADTTLTIGFAKTGLVADSAINHAGRLVVLPLGELTKRAETSQPEATVATAADLAPLLRRRAFDTHKGHCGRVAIVAGSRGFVGAAAMCAEGALRGGAGLVTLFVELDFYDIAATRVTPEVMVKAVDSHSLVLEERADVIAIGPGLGLRHASAILDVITRASQPMVVDADAINALASDLHTLDRAAGPRLLTPHPGEMVRLDANADVHPRRFTAEAFTHRWPHALLFEGARTIVGQRGKPFSYNSTGHPGLATGGVGDVMTGLVAALAGQGLSLYDAARVGSWIVGRAAERAVFTGAESAETLRPTALLDHLAGAFHDLRERVL
jgi:ADP-dependent NAD(P)H-hydrate dehydratase / NAD(P)H-hydrate epimerase